MADNEIDQREQVRCKKTNKLLSLWDEKGIYLYCKECRTEHLVTWEELPQNKRQLISHTAKR